jgi:hypothetical protein
MRDGSDTRSVVRCTGCRAPIKLPALLELTANRISVRASTSVYCSACHPDLVRASADIARANLLDGDS